MFRALSYGVTPSSALSTDSSNCCKNWFSEELYIQFTLDISTIAKYIKEPRVATGRYTSRCSLMSRCFSSASTSFCWTSFALLLVLFSASISSMSSIRLPEVLDSLTRRALLYCSRILELLVISSRSCYKESSSDFCFLESTRPSSCCSSPVNVTVKSMIVVLAASSGEK